MAISNYQAAARALHLECQIRRINLSSEGELLDLRTHVNFRIVS